MEKLYYSISEVARKLNVPQSTLRFWEKEFPQLRPSLSSGGTRRYTYDDIDTAQLILYLTRHCHLSLEGARHRMSTTYDMDLRRIKAIEGLKAVRTELKAIMRELNSREALAEETIIDLKP